MSKTDKVRVELVNIELKQHLLEGEYGANDTNMNVDGNSEENKSNYGEQVILSADEAIIRAGGYWRYQWILGLIVSFYTFNNVVFIYTLTYYEVDPKVTCQTDEGEEFHLCDKKEACGDRCFQYRYLEGEAHHNYIAQFDLLCNSNLVGLIGTLYYLTNMFSSFAFGQLADIVGRKPMLAVCSMFGIIGSIVLYTSYSITQLLIASSILGIAGGYISCDIYLILDSIPRKYYAHQVAMLNMTFNFGEVAMALLMYINYSWRTNAFVVLFFYTYFLFGYCYYVEPPKFYMGKHNYSKARTQLSRIARKNGIRDYNTDFIFEEEIETTHLLASISEPGSIIHHKQRNFKDVFRFPVTRWRYLLIFLLYIINGLVFYGIAFVLPKLYGNPKINMIIGGCAEAAGCFSMIFLVNSPLLGRKWSTLILYILSALGCFLYVFVGGAEHVVIAYIFIVIARYGISGAYAGVNIFTHELFPTSIKAVAMGSFGFSSRIGSTVAPYLAAVLTFNPLILFGSSSVFGALLTYFLPETRGKPIFDTLESAQAAYAQTQSIHDKATSD